MTGFDIQTLALPGALLLLITSLVLVLANDWRPSLVALGVQYIGVFVLVAAHWPLMMAITKLVSGWISVAVLGIALSSTNLTRSERAASNGMQGVWKNFISGLSGWIFRLLAAAMIVLVALTMAPQIADWITGVQIDEVMGAIFLIGLGLLHLGLTDMPYRVILALLTVLSGFEVIYAAVERSTLVAGLLAGVTLGLAMIGAYLLVTTAEEVDA